METLQLSPLTGTMVGDEQNHENQISCWDGAVPHGRPVQAPLFSFLFLFSLHQLLQQTRIEKLIKVTTV